MNEQQKTKQDYREEIEKIQASDALRQHILTQAAKQSAHPTPARSRRPLVWALSGAAVLIVLVFALPWLAALLTPASGGGPSHSTTAGGSGSGSSDGRHFDLYKGPILPLTAVGGGEGLLVNRHLVLDLSAFVPLAPSGNPQLRVLRVEDRYTVENPTDKDISLKAVVPFVSSLNQTPDLMPTLSLNGKPLDSRIFSGSIMNNLDKDGLNWEYATSADAYEKALADGIYLRNALSGLAVKGTTPVTVYTFKNLTKLSEFGDAANLGLNAVIDPDKSKIMAFGLSGMTFDDQTGHVIISGWLMHGEDQGVVAVIGEPLKDVTLKGYTDGGCTQELQGFSGQVETSQAILEDVFRQQLDVYVQKSVNLTEQFKQHSDTRQQRYFADAVYDSSLALLQEHLRQNHLRYWAPVIHMDSLLGDALALTRMLYLEADITVPAHQAIELTIDSIRPSHQNIFGSSRHQKDKNLFGFDWLTRTGDSLPLRQLTMDLILPEDATIRYQNLGLQADATGKVPMTLDADTTHFYLAITVPDYVK